MELHPYVIRSTDSVVELWSGYRIQFGGMEKHRWQKEAKATLKAALAGFVIPEGSAFYGFYDSTESAPVDTENSLFTNFIDEMPKGVGFLRFERGVSNPPQPPTPVELVGGHLHYYRYEVGGQWTTWEPDQNLATWKRMPRRVAADGSARPAWFALREGNSTGLVEPTGVQLDPDAHFGLSITIHATNSGPRNAISNSESIVDGIIAAFHSDRFSEDVFAALAPKLPTIAGQDLRDALDNPVGPLFDTPAIVTKGAFVQISPADERCRVGEVRICHDSAGKWPELSGEIFSIKRARTKI